MTDKTIITLKTLDQQHSCTCGLVLPIADAPAHVLFDCPGPCPRCHGRGHYNGLLTETGTFTLMRCPCTYPACVICGERPGTVAAADWDVCEICYDAITSPWTGELCQ